MPDESGKDMGLPEKSRGPDAQPSPDRMRTKRWVRGLLALSLGVNLLIAGLVVGAYIHDRGQIGELRGSQPPEARVLRELGLGPFLNAFPPQERREMAQLMREQVGNFRVNRDALADELEAILQAIRSEPYDHAVLLVVIERQKERITSRAEVGRDVVLGAIEGMSPAEREQFADRMERSIHQAMEKAGRPPRP